MASEHGVQIHKTPMHIKMFQTLKKEKKKEADAGNMLLGLPHSCFPFSQTKVMVSEGFLPAILPCVRIYSLAD